MFSVAIFLENCPLLIIVSLIKRCFWVVYILPTLIMPIFTLSSKLKPLLFSCFSSLNFFKLFKSSSFPIKVPKMDATSQIHVSSHTQSSAEVVIIAKFHQECKIPRDCTLELLSSKYQGWESNPSFLPANAIVISDFHLQNLRLPLPPFFHYIFTIHDIHPL